MGISLGNSSKKPYVGSKEVQEAYVGSQLVYRAVPPFDGVFFDSATQTILDGYVLTGSASKIGYASGSFLASNGYYIIISSLSGGGRAGISWSNVDIGVYNTLIITSPMLSNYARSYIVTITFEDNTNINTTKQIWYNNPARIALSNKKIKSIEIKNEYATSDGYISNITVE